MTKKLLCLLLILSGISLYQGKNLCNSLLEKSLTVPTNVVISNISTSTAHVTWNSIPSNQYILRWRVAGTSAWVSVSLTLPYYTLAGLMSCKTYEIQVIDSLNNPIDNSGSFFFTTLSVDSCNSASTDSAIMHISNVTVTPNPTSGFSPMVSSSGTSNYTDYRPDPTRRVDLVYGSVNNVFSLTKSGPVSPSAAYVNVWIDYNANGIFESSELTVSTTSSSGNLITSSFNVPVSAATGGTVNCAVTMRVIFSNTFVPNGCGNFGYGEVEDYGVYFSTAPNLAVSEADKHREINIYPNPASDILHISGIYSDVEFELYSAVGQVISHGKTKNKSIDVRQLVKGVYFIQLKNREDFTRLKFIKK